MEGADCMEDSILLTIKKMLGLEPEYTPFDADIIVLINATLMVLTQADVGPSKGFRITGTDETWNDFLTNHVMLEAVKEYIYLRVKMIFDPPASSVAMDAFKSAADELLSRIAIQAESADKFDFMDEDSLIRGGSPINIGIAEDDDD